MTLLRSLTILCLLIVSSNHAFTFRTSWSPLRSSALQMSVMPEDSCPTDKQRRSLFANVNTLTACTLAYLTTTSEPVNAVMFLDPQMYGDQENRVSAVDSLRESVRRSILIRPSLAPAFYVLALMDGLSYDAKTKEGGPDGSIVQRVLSSTEDSPFVLELKEAALALVASKKSLVKLTAITIGDAVALGGAEAVQAIGGPVLPVQLGRMDLPPSQKPPTSSTYSPPPLSLLSDNSSPDQVVSAFYKSGMTEREMTALLGGLLTITAVQKSRSSEDWKNSARPKFRERGKIGRMDEYKALSDEDIASAMAKDYDDDDDELDKDDSWYIADTFGTRDQAFGAKATKDIDQKSFNKFLKDLNNYNSKRMIAEGNQPYGWIGDLLLDRNKPSIQSWVEKYSSSFLNYEKDLSIAFNSITQLGAEYTGGKYESLLKNRPRKMLNN